MAAKTKVFLIKSDHGKECVMRLPVGKYGGITTRGMKMVSDRFFDGATNTPHWLKYALGLESFSSGKTLIEAIEKYYKDQL